MKFGGRRESQLYNLEILVNSLTRLLLKKLFFFFYPHTLTFRLKRPVYRGFKGEGKCEGRKFTLTLTLTQKSVLNPICPAKVQSKSKDKSKNESVKRLRKRSVIIRERFLISSSVAAGSQSAMQQVEFRVKNVETTFGGRR